MATILLAEVKATVWRISQKEPQPVEVQESRPSIRVVRPNRLMPPDSSRRFALTSSASLFSGGMPQSGPPTAVVSFWLPTQGLHLGLPRPCWPAIALLAPGSVTWVFREIGIAPPFVEGTFFLLVV